VAALGSQIISLTKIDREGSSLVNSFSARLLHSSSLATTDRMTIHDGPGLSRPKVAVNVNGLGKYLD
jgi:hypothetical protein